MILPGNKYRDLVPLKDASGNNTSCFVADENDNWYSSDEEDGPKPSNILMNLGIPPGGPMAQQQQQQQQPANQKPPVLNLQQMLNVIKSAATSQPPPVMG